MSSRQNASQLPKDLRERPRWIRWEARTRDGKTTKVPIAKDGSLASTTDPKTWSEYEALKGSPRLGFVFTKEDGLVGIDLDHVLVASEPCSWARQVVQECSSYTEVSPSGQGLHVIARGSKPEWLASRTDMPAGAGLEVYDHGRYFTVTGNVFESYSELRAIDAALVFEFLRPAAPPTAPARGRGGDEQHFDVSIHDVIQGLREDRRIPHPFHDSSTGANFQVDKGGLTWRCWRHGCTGNALHLLGQREKIVSCGVKPSREQWRAIFEVARREGLVAEADAVTLEETRAKVRELLYK